MWLPVVGRSSTWPIKKKVSKMTKESFGFPSVAADAVQIFKSCHHVHPQNQNQWQTPQQRQLTTITDNTRPPVKNKDLYYKH